MKAQLKFLLFLFFAFCLSTIAIVSTQAAIEEIPASKELQEKN
jgi:hypothetical protein